MPFEKGRSGNPVGRPVNEETNNFRYLARKKCLSMFEVNDLYGMSPIDRWLTTGDIRDQIKIFTTLANLGFSKPAPDKPEESISEEYKPPVINISINKEDLLDATESDTSEGI